MSAFVECGRCGREHLVYAGLWYWCSTTTERCRVELEDRVVVGPEDVRGVTESTT